MIGFDEVATMKILPSPLVGLDTASGVLFTYL